MLYNQEVFTCSFTFYKVKLHFTENALQLIAKKAAAGETGARGLRSVMEDILTEAMFEIPDAREGKEKIIAVLVNEESVGPLHRRGCGAKIFRGDGALELYVYQNNIKLPGLIQSNPRRSRIARLPSSSFASNKALDLSDISLFFIDI
uniref:Clp ATPase C-terminal domain-containing protein n=1 Tax=Arundo donax TaxID=35708 RepID=A0A0A9C6E2_ARUDO